MMSPWGKVDNKTVIGPGILIVDTPSHGGAYVPDIFLKNIPEEEQIFAEKWSGSRNWYEEDLAIASVTHAFPELFPNFPQEKNDKFYTRLRKCIDNNFRGGEQCKHQ